MKRKIWGQLLSIDLEYCNPKTLKDRKKLELFCKELCKKIDMKRYGKPILKEFGEGTLHGYSITQFIETSSITAHLDEYDNRAFIDIFSCKKFDKIKAKNFAKEFFEAKKMRYKNFYRY